MIELSFRESHPLNWRAAWLVDGCDEETPGVVISLLPVILRRLKEHTPDGVLRSYLRLCTRHPVPESYQGSLIDLCFRIMITERFPVAVKVHAMQIVYNHALIYPELKQELAAIIQDQYANNSAGFRARGMMLLDRLQMQPDRSG